MTNSGVFINVFETTPEMIEVNDIAHALSRLPRFGGHLNRHYSVAQHSVLCAKRAKTLEDKRAALMHDASESYLLDIPTPIKARLLEYKLHEKKLMSVIFTKYNITEPLSKAVKKIDNDMLLFEWENLVIKDTKSFKCWGRNKAKKEFLKMFNELFGEIE
jgi:5'-deoxynucleotidase YfbR-like HD superfamily hydrolase